MGRDASPKETAASAARDMEEMALRSVEFFCGIGVLGLGLHGAGFRHEQVVDIDDTATGVVRLNQRLGHPAVQGWKVRTADARYADLSDVEAEPDLVAGGCPCQPWSVGGQGRGAEDPRDMWPTAARIIGQLRPRAFALENVSGMASRFREYLDYAVAMLSCPTVPRQDGESVEGHAARLADAAKARRDAADVRYRVTWHSANAKEFGTAQARQRIFVVGLRSDLTTSWKPPAPTHDEDELFASMWESGRYWHEHGLPRPEASDAVKAKLASRRRNHGRRPATADMFARRPLRQRTLRDAIGDLPEPTARAPEWLPQHVLPERAAKAYGSKHSGSELDRPAKCLRSGDHGCPGGENFFTMGDGTARHFTSREAARLMDVPDDFHVHARWNTAMKHLGNAVPARLAQAVGETLATALAG